MNKLISFLQNIINTGVITIKEPEEIKRIRLSNLVTLTVFITGTPFAFLFYFYGTPLSWIVLATYILAFALVLKLNQIRRFQLARMVMTLLMNVAVIHFAFWYGEGSGLHHMLIPFACVPFLVFRRTDIWPIALGVFLSLGGFLLIDFVPYTPINALDAKSELVIYYAITTMAMLWLLLEMLYLSNQNHIAISNLTHQRKNQTAAIVHAQEQERRRTARDLHDSLGQLLSTMKVYYERFPDQPHSVAPNMMELIDQAVSEIRSISFNLMPQILESKGLEPALNELINKVRQTVDFEVFLYIRDIEQIPMKMELQFNIYRVVQESIANIIKHAKAKEVNIHVINTNNELTITIEDDGVGFNPEEGVEKRSGLHHIAARIEWCDGKFEIDSGTKIGTTLIIVLPLVKHGAV